ncbi:GNAT family N-acetyltransferase [uncultured Jatrophihabitans sp.]|uniref:GNAT family N-acetyltransferase n=1 Tax=uncultured Jatrophihabitans sp. TaxID=1610747 RepID=UPI0035CA730A
MTTPEQVVLRTMQDGDDDVVYRCQTDLDAWEQRSPAPPRPVTREQWQARQAARAADAQEAEFVVEAAGRPVGRCAIVNVDPLARHAEISISLVEEARGRGIGTAAVAQLVAFGFERWNLHRLHLVVLASNEPARRAYLKAGFVEEGRLREHAWIRGHYDDELRMGLLCADWLAARG